MSVTVLLELTARPGLGDDLEVFLTEMLPGTRTADGCEHLVLARARRDAHAFLVAQVWQSRSHYLTYSQWRQDRGDLAPFDRLLAGSPRLAFYDNVSIY